MDGRGLIGIVSGLGPLAGSDVLAKALAYAATEYGAVEDADYPDVVLFSHGIDDFDSTGNIEEDFVRGARAGGAGDRPAPPERHRCRV